MTDPKSPTEAVAPITFDHTCGGLVRAYDCKGCFPPPTHAVANSELARITKERDVFRGAWNGLEHWALNCGPGAERTMQEFAATMKLALDKAKRDQQPTPAPTESATGAKCKYCNRVDCESERYRDDARLLRMCRHAVQLERDFLANRVGRLEGNLRQAETAKVADGEAVPTARQAYLAVRAERDAPRSRPAELVTYFRGMARADNIGALWTTASAFDHAAELLEASGDSGSPLSSASPPRDLRAPIPMFLTCPACTCRHIDEGEFATKAHHTHSCQECGLTWRPAVVATVGVKFLPGFKNDVADDPAPPSPPRDLRADLIAALRKLGKGELLIHEIRNNGFRWLADELAKEEGG